jgi:hypothetical protein
MDWLLFHSQCVAVACSENGRARMPNLSPAIYSAHDHAEGEFFSAANENAGRISEAAQAGQNGQEITGRGGGLQAGCASENR